MLHYYNFIAGICYQLCVIKEQSSLKWVNLNASKYRVLSLENSKALTNQVHEAVAKWLFSFIPADLTKAEQNSYFLSSKPFKKINKQAKEPCSAYQIKLYENKRRSSQSFLSEPL